jgi:hypothetical protein
MIRKRPSREERHKRMDESLKLAEEHYQARLKIETSAASPWERLAGAVPEVAEETKAPAPSRALAPTASAEGVAPLPRARGKRAHERLREIGFYLGRAASEHIFNSHAYGKMHDKSQFNMAYATREALDEIIAQGIEEAGPDAWGSVTDFEGRYYTLCQRRGTDWHLTRDGWEPTELFVVVSDRYYNPAVDDYDHVVVTAYPVSKDW